MYWAEAADKTSAWCIILLPVCMGVHGNVVWHVSSNAAHACTENCQWIMCWAEVADQTSQRRIILLPVSMATLCGAFAAMRHMLEAMRQVLGDVLGLSR
jgi:hypothetical protein